MKFADATIVVVFRKFRSVAAAQDFEVWLGPEVHRNIRNIPALPPHTWSVFFGMRYNGESYCTQAVRDESALMLLKLTYYEHIVDIMYLRDMDDILKSKLEQILNELDQKIMDQYKD